MTGQVACVRYRFTLGRLMAMIAGFALLLAIVLETARSLTGEQGISILGAIGILTIGGVLLLAFFVLPFYLVLSTIGWLVRVITSPLLRSERAANTDRWARFPIPTEQNPRPERPRPCPSASTTH